jgi:hypothetical protein
VWMRYHTIAGWSRVLVRLHAVEQPQHTWLAVSASVWRTEGSNAAGGTTACFPLSSSSPAWGEGGLFHTTREAARIKKPQPGTVGVGTHAAAPFPRKDVSALCRAGLLARGIPLLSAPSQGKAPQWSLQISIRLQLRGSDGFAPSSLVTDSDCDQPYQRHIRFCVGAYGRAIRFVKDISV